MHQCSQILTGITQKIDVGTNKLSGSIDFMGYTCCQLTHRFEFLGMEQLAVQFLFFLIFMETFSNISNNGNEAIFPLGEFYILLDNFHRNGIARLGNMPCGVNDRFFLFLGERREKCSELSFIQIRFEVKGGHVVQLFKAVAHLIYCTLVCVDIS